MLSGIPDDEHKPPDCKRLIPGYCIMFIGVVVVPLCLTFRHNDNRFSAENVTSLENEAHFITPSAEKPTIIELMP